MVKSSKKNIFVEIGVQFLNSEDGPYATELLEDKFKKLSEEIGVDIEYEYGMLKDPIWDSNKFNFAVLNDIPNIISIQAIYIPKNMRRKGFMTKVLKEIIETFAVDSLVFLELGILNKEYPKLKYTTDKEEAETTGKKHLDVNDTLGWLQWLFARYGFIPVDGYLHKDEYRFMMLFGSPLGVLAKEYMESVIVLKDSIMNSTIQAAYRIAMNNVIDMMYYNNIYNYPYVIPEDKKLTTFEPADMSTEGGWYTGWEADPENPDQIKDAEHSIAEKNLEALKNIGARQCVVDINNGKGVQVLDYSSVYVEVMNEEQFDDNMDFSSDSVLKLKGFKCLDIGVWVEATFWFDTESGCIFDVDLKHELAYVGSVIGIKNIDV